MTIQQLIDELQGYDPALQVVTSDGYGSVDSILQVSLCNINDRDDIVDEREVGSVKVLVLGWNQ